MLAYPVPFTVLRRAPLDPARGGALVLETDARGAEGGPHHRGVGVGKLSSMGRAWENDGWMDGCVMVQLVSSCSGE